MAKTINLKKLVDRLEELAQQGPSPVQSPPSVRTQARSKAKLTEEQQIEFDSFKQATVENSLLVQGLEKKLKEAKQQIDKLTLLVSGHGEVSTLESDYRRSQLKRHRGLTLQQALELYPLSS